MSPFENLDPKASCIRAAFGQNGFCEVVRNSEGQKP
jgi:hypothetical protein